MNHEELDPNRTPYLNLPILTEEQIRDLHEKPDRGITRVGGIIRFWTFKEWMDTGGVVHKSDFHMLFAPGVFGQMKREMQHMQRFAELYPDHLERLIDLVQTRWGNQKRVFTETEEHDFHDAYETLADLVDANDDLMILTNGEDIPFGQARPRVLLST